MSGVSQQTADCWQSAHGTSLARCLGSVSVGWSITFCVGPTVEVHGECSMAASTPQPCSCMTKHRVRNATFGHDPCHTYLTRVDAYTTRQPTHIRCASTYGNFTYPSTPRDKTSHSLLCHSEAKQCDACKLCTSTHNCCTSPLQRMHTAQHIAQCSPASPAS